MRACCAVSIGVKAIDCRSVESPLLLLLMTRGSRVFSLMVAMAVSFPGLVLAQQTSDRSHGIFADSNNIGATGKGSTVFDPASGSYRITGGGYDMWYSADAFRMNWVQLSGDATLTADVHISPGAVPLAKAVLIFRQSLDPGSAYADVAIHGDGHITLQFRETTGAKTADTTSTEHGSVRLRIERKKDVFTAYAESSDGKMVAVGSTTVVLKDPVYVGLGVCSHSETDVSTATFSNVKLERSAQSAMAGK
jgi:TolB protein